MVIATTETLLEPLSIPDIDAELKAIIRRRLAGIATFGDVERMHELTRIRTVMLLPSILAKRRKLPYTARRRRL